MNIAIRIKVSHEAGLGHWVRQCHLARALQESGCTVTLFPDIYEPLETLPTPDLTVIPVKNHDAFFSQLPQAVSLVILDVHDTGVDFILKLRDKVRLVAGFEDLGEGRDHLDLLVDCNLPPREAERLPQNVTALFGENYSLLAPEYETLSKVERDFSRGVEKFLVTMGGTDPKGLTLPVVKMLLEINQMLKITAVLNPQHCDACDLKNLAEQKQLILIPPVTSLGDLLTENDAVICSGGVTLHEALAVGTPAFVVPQVAHQEDKTRQMENRGAAKLLGPPATIKKESLEEAVQSSPDSLQTMSHAGREIIDGRGLERLKQSILKLMGK